MMLTFVIPSYNRLLNLNLVLESIRLQTRQGFEVVIADDGSNDGTDELILELQDDGECPFPVKYYRHKHAGYRVSLMRNQGARLRNRETTHLWFLDSDVLLPRDAVAHVTKTVAELPEVVICGRYDWLPPMRITKWDVRMRWNDIVTWKLPPLDVPKRARDGRPDHRAAMEDGTLFQAHTVYEAAGLGTLSGNLIVPVKWFEITGGFDENIVGQGQDGEFGHNLQRCGAPGIYCGHICGQHISHAYDVKWMRTSQRATVQYIRDKYNLSSS